MSFRIRISSRILSYWTFLISCSQVRVRAIWESRSVLLFSIRLCSSSRDIFGFRVKIWLNHSVDCLYARVVIYEGII